jgi:hypothetical protein
MNEIFLKYKELLKQTPPLTAAEIEKKMMKDYGWTWQEIKLAQEYCTPPESKNYWVDDKPSMSKEWPDCEPKQQWDHSIPVTNIRTPPPTPVPPQYCGASINSASAQDWDAVRPDMVNSPPHYTKGGIETIDFIQAKLSPEEYRGYLRGNLLKYASRLGEKDSDDAGKASWYAQRLEML